MKIKPLALFLLSAVALLGQTFPSPEFVSVSKTPANDHITDNLVIPSGLTLTLNGTLEGTPTGGEFDLSNVSLALPDGLSLEDVDLRGDSTVSSGATFTATAGSRVNLNGNLEGIPTGGYLNLRNISLDVSLIADGDSDIIDLSVPGSPLVYAPWRFDDEPTFLAGFNANTATRTYEVRGHNRRINFATQFDDETYVGNPDTTGRTYRTEYFVPTEAEFLAGFTSEDAPTQIPGFANRTLAAVDNVNAAHIKDHVSTGGAGGHVAYTEYEAAGATVRLHAPGTGTGTINLHMPFAPTQDGMTFATELDVQEALDTADGRISTLANEPALEGDLDVDAWHNVLGIEDGAAADQNAGEVPSTPTGDIAATDVQAALAELAAEKATLSAVGAREPRQGVISDGSGPLGTTQDNDSLVWGSADLSYFGFWSLPDYTPASLVVLWAKKTDGGVGVLLYLGTDGTLNFVQWNGASADVWTSTDAINTTNGHWAGIGFSADNNGNLTFWHDGATLGNPIDISANADVSQSTTAPLYWLTNSNGSTAYAGTAGEQAIGQGVWTAAQFAQIHANGTAVGMGLTMYQHLIPEGRGPLIPDVSGNHNHAVLGSHIGTDDFVRPEPYAIDNTTRTALRSDGSNGTKMHAVVASPGDGGFSIEWRGIWPTNARVNGADWLVCLTSSLSDVVQPRSFAIYYYNNTATPYVRIQLYGATTSDYRRLSADDALYDQLEAHGLRGEEIALYANRSATGVSVFLQVEDGPVRNITALFTESTGGAAPSWGDEVDGPYFVPFYRNSTVSSAHELRGLRLYNAAADDDEAADAMSPVPVGKKWQAGTTDLASDATWLNDGNIESWSAASPTGYTADNTVSNGTARKAISPPINDTGVQYRVSFNAVLTSGAAPRLWLGSGSTPRSNYHTITAGANEAILTTTGTVNRVASGFNNGLSGAWSISDFQIDALGLVAGLSTTDGGGYQPKNPRTENGSSHWTMEGGVTWVGELAKPGDRITVERIYDYDEISHFGADTEHATREPGWAVREVRAYVLEAFDSGVYLLTGGPDGWSQFAGSMAFDVVADYVTASADQADSSADVPVYIKLNTDPTQGKARIVTVLERIN